MTDWVVYALDPSHKPNALAQAFGPFTEADALARVDMLKQKWPTWTVEALPVEALSESFQAPASTLPEFVLHSQDFHYGSPAPGEPPINHVYISVDPAALDAIGRGHQSSGEFGYAVLPLRPA